MYHSLLLKLPWLGFPNASYAEVHRRSIEEKKQKVLLETVEFPLPFLTVVWPTACLPSSVARLGGFPPNCASFDRLGPEINALGG